jgi:hypothetical protein
MIGAVGGRKARRYYRCCLTFHCYKWLEGRGCEEKSVRVDVLDPTVWEFVLEVLTDREKFEQGLLDAQEAEHQVSEPMRARMDTVLALIAETEAEAAKLLSFA